MQLKCFMMHSLQTEIYFFFYAFLAFNLKGKNPKQKGFWWCLAGLAKLLRLLVVPPLMITHKETLLPLPGCKNPHPLRKKLNLLACHLCEDSTRRKAERATDIFLQSWRQSSKKQYDAHIRLLFYTKRQAIPICPSISMAVELLTTLYDEGLSYNNIKSARCALSTILESSASATQHLVSPLMLKGHQSRPPLPGYPKTWDVNLVLQYIGSIGNSQELSLKDLTSYLTHARLTVI